VGHRAQKRYGLFEGTLIYFGTEYCDYFPGAIHRNDTGRRKKQLDEHIGQLVRRVLRRPVHIIDSLVAADLLQRILVPQYLTL
jgi:hypothetical protein